MTQRTVIKALLVEDEVDDYIITRNLFRELTSAQFTLEWVSSFEEARARIALREHDIYLVDYRLGAHSGLELLKQAVEQNFPAPIILLTGAGDCEVDIEAIQWGAADYLVKGQITPALLQRSITHSLQRKQTERKLQASQEQLRHAQKMESMGNLAGGIAHDFNNILGIISAYSSRLQSPQLSAVQISESASAINQAVQRGASLVRQILTFARKTDVRPEKVNLNILLRELMRMLEETFPKTIVFRMEEDRSLPELLADVSQLHQTFLNLCVNSRDAMPSGGTITIKTGSIPGARLRAQIHEAADCGYAVISVRDSGMGMDQETANRIFEPFFTTKSSERGTGLGLATVYGIVQSHKGFIQVHSAPGQGATFTVYLPLPVATEERTPTALPETLADSRGGGETILFVEDEDLLLELMTAMLSEKGYRVITARDGYDAIAKFKQHRTEIDLVISDMGLPSIDGFDVFLKIREIDSDARILLSSGYLEPKLKTRLLAAGAGAFVQKPYVPSELFGVIRRLLDHESAGAARLEETRFFTKSSAAKRATLEPIVGI